MGLSQEVEGSFDIRTQGHHVYVLERISESRTKLSLQLILKKLQTDLKAKGVDNKAPLSPRNNPYVHIFCETLELQSLEGDYPRIRWLRIIASNIRVAQSANAEELPVLKFPNIWVLSLIAAHIPRDVTIYVGKSGAIPLINDPSPSIGTHYHGGLSEASKTSTIIRIAPIELSRVNARDFEAKWPNKRPLELSQFLIALFKRTTAKESIWLGFQDDQRPEDEIHAFKLITMATKDSPDYADLYDQACTLWRQLEIPSRAGYFVPQIGSTGAKSIVQSWQAAVSYIGAQYSSKEFQKAVSKQMDQASNEITSQVYTTAGKIMNTVVDINQTEAGFNSASFESDLKAKSDTVDKAYRRLQDMKGDVDNKMRAFGANIAKYQAEQAAKAKEEQILLYLEIAVDVGLTLYEGPAKLIQGGAKLSKAARKAKNIEDAIKKTKRLKNIGELCGKFEKVHEVKEVAAKFVDAYFRPKANANAAASKNTDDIKTRLDACMREVEGADGFFDWGEAKMMWDDFEIDNEGSFVDMAELPIDGKEDYKNALKKLTCRRRDWMVAQKEAQEVRRKATQALAYKQLLESKKSEYVLDAQKTISTAPPMGLVKATLLGELDSARRSLFLAVHRWVLVWAYQNGRVTLPKAKRPRVDDSVADFVTGIAALESEMEGSVLHNWQNYKPSLVFSTSDPKSPFEQEWKMMLQSVGQVQFLVPFDLPNGEPFSYVQTASVNIEGLRIVPAPTAGTWDPTWTKDLIQTEVEFGPVLGQFTPSNNNKQIQFYTGVPLSSTCKVAWDTNTVSKVATFQGAGDEVKSVVRPSLYSYGRIRLLPLEVGKSSAGFGKLDRWDLSAVGKVTVTLEVQFAELKKT